ncbi:methyltransferase domain-containing protein [Polymorphobacter sp.]|uniref:methyltransferase domain-containing protein n=1 Tax=Polymorphobacter sp. TaxID=1909290 RepID=UPI003F6FC67D
MTSWWHEQRLDAAMAAIEACGATSVADLGCGDGDLLCRLAVSPRIERLAGVDVSAEALARLRLRLGRLGSNTPVEILHGSMTDGTGLDGYDCAALIETIEHLEPAELSALERALFTRMRPPTIVITTPNAEFNGLLGVPPHRFRHPGHRFEWDRARFRRWAEAVAARHGYAIACTDIAGQHPRLGGSSQMALFTT